ncbi:MAG: rhodanese-related sulfurtransferase [Hyphomicrobiales bacterium]|nr:rhodanese-related sulfurtransferase [Hyphomicrobiales bacterium]
MFLSTNADTVRVAAFYRFQSLEDCGRWRAPLLEACRQGGVKGTILLAGEGVNGTIAGSPQGVAGVLQLLGQICGLAADEVKFSEANEMPFHRMKVRLKKEIVTMGVLDLDPAADAGTYVDPADWNQLIADPDIVVVDTRNGYEVALGTFAGAVDPGTASFSEFPTWAEQNRERLAGRKVAMFCTGGIRCEKATAYLRSLGLRDVFHLKGGILKYLEDVPETESRWQGECFVFDERVSVGHGLREGEAELCRACRRPLTAADRQAPHYRPGISCAYCHEERSEEDRAGYAERHRQVGLAGKRGVKPHIGG